ncbi:MAG: O-antigen polymerase [Candidatus Acidiferrales bacterium]
MSALILAALLALTVVNYRTCRDLRYPPFIFSLLWLVVTTLYYFSPIPIDPIGFSTALIFVVVILSFTGGAWLAFLLRAPGSPVNDGEVARPVGGSSHPRIRVLLLFASVCLLPVLFAKAMQLAEQSGIENFFVGLRVELLTEGSAGYGFLGNASMLSFFTTFIYAIEKGNGKRERLEYYLSLAVSSVYAVLGTGRTAVFLIIVVLTGISSMRKGLSIRRLAAGAAIFLLCFGLFAISLGKGGDLQASWSENLSLIQESLVQYALGPLPAFDRVVRTGTGPEYGRNVFLDVLNLSRRMTGRPVISPIQQEVAVPFPTNVYTAIEPVYIDFGILGVVLAFGLIGAASTYFYLGAVAGDRLFIFCYSISLVPLLYSTFSDQYFAPLHSWFKYLIAAYCYFGIESTSDVWNWRRGQHFDVPATGNRLSFPARGDFTA